MLQVIKRWWLPLASLIVGGFLGWWFLNPTPPPEIRIIHDTKQVVVEKPVIEYKDVIKVVKDPQDQALIKNLLNENKDLKAKVTNLTITVAVLKAENGGTVIVPTDGVNTGSFQDYQLTASWNEQKFNYMLEQKFKVVTTSGRDKDGRPLSLVELYQIRPNGPVKIPTATTAIFADETVNRWFVSPRIQAGVGFTVGLSGSPSGVVGFQWLKRGRSRDPKDIRWAAGSPAAIFNNGPQDVGVLPFSFNLGTIKHSPFSNVWISPFIGKKSVGGAITATF